MIRTLAALLGLAVIAAVFAGIYYAPSELEWKEEGRPAFSAAPGEVRSFGMQPSIEGGLIHVELLVTNGPVDVYVMETTWAAALPVESEGRLGLNEPFSFLAEHSFVGVNGTWSTTLVSDGKTWHTLVVDNGDNYYAHDTSPDNRTASIQITTRYLEEEERSLWLGYIATTPSILLVAVTLWRQVRRRRGLAPSGDD